MSEKQLQAAIIDEAKRLGWRVVHFRTSRNADGSYSTAYQGHAGYPDLTLLRPPRLVFAELKVGKREPDQEQCLWLNGLKTVAGVETYVWRETDWLMGLVDEVLR